MENKTGENAMTQKLEVLIHLQQHGDITPIDALKEFGCFRLSARIFELREEGYQIDTFYETVGKKTFARYVLMKKQPDQKELAV